MQPTAHFKNLNYQSTMSTTTYTPVSLDKFATLNSTTSAILELAKALVIDKEFLSRADFSKLIEKFNWSKETVKSYINIGVAFAGIEIGRLVNIEPRTLFKITSSKRFESVVDGIINAVGNITQKFVENLIKSNKKTPVRNQDTPTIWKGEGATRKCVIPNIVENDQFTGTTIQRAMDSEKITAQKFVREAAAVREAFKMGAFSLVKELPAHLAAILGIQYEAPTQSNDDDDDDDEVEVRVAETRRVTNDVVETVPVVGVSVPTIEVIQTVVEKTAPPIEVVYQAVEEKAPTEIQVVQTVVKEEAPISIEIPKSSERQTNRENLRFTLTQQNVTVECLSAEEVATLLVESSTWSDITAIIGAIDEQTRIASWALLDRESQARIQSIKKAAVEETAPYEQTMNNETPIVKVGDTVIWVNCYPHLSSWNPFIVENIEDDYAKLNNLKTPVPVEELSLVCNF
jgi:hypothetical protein